MKYLKLFENFYLTESIEINMNQLDIEFLKTTKEIFGETVKLEDIKVTYRPSTDTGSKPTLSISVTIPQTKESNKGLFLSIDFDKDGVGTIYYDNYSKDKQSTSEEFNTILIPAFKKASTKLLEDLIKQPDKMSKATVGLGYKYEEKDQEDLNRYVSEIKNLNKIKIR
jgi:hypothetical protein